MAVKFCFASGYSARIGSCGIEQVPYPATCEEDTEVAKRAPFRLGDLGSLRYYTYTLEDLQARVEAAKEQPDDMRNIWRSRIICILAPIETIFCINFIPSNPHQPQTLQVMRMHDLNESASSYQVYCYDYSPYKFILPTEHADQIFNLSQWDFSQIEPGPLILALQYLKNEKALRGMALTLRSDEGNLNSYLWIKP